MDQFIHIKCPYCGTLLKVKQQAGLEKSVIPCPICKRKSPFTSFSQAIHKASEETEIRGLHKKGGSAEDTQLQGALTNSLIGSLVEKSGKVWNLHSGVNSIGRKLKDDPQQVDIPIFDYTGERVMSRKHAKIEVIRLADGSCKHVLYNWQNQNPTLIGGDPVESEDRIVLHDGTTIKFGNLDVKFVIDDSESTII